MTNRFRLGASILLGITALVLIALMDIGVLRQYARYAPVPDVKVQVTAALVARGESVASGYCSSCHSRTGAMQGGMDLGKAFSLPLGSFVATNLTPAGPLRNWSDGQLFRAIRNAVDSEGRWLTIMSYTNSSRLDDADVMAVIAYLRSLSAEGLVTTEPPDRFSPLGLLLLGAGLLPTGEPVDTRPPR
jgi:mono/diheme cytochrome c family protein